MAIPGGYSQFSPMAPEDPEVRNIIDKLAVFVARNGPEFEQMTKDKQRDNPKFYFLSGGDFHPYYRWKVSQEQATLYGQVQQPTAHPVPASVGVPALLQTPPVYPSGMSQPHPPAVPGGNKVLLGSYPGSSTASFQQQPQQGYTGTGFSGFQTSQAGMGGLATSTYGQSGHELQGGSSLVSQPLTTQEHTVPTSEAAPPPWVKKQQLLPLGESLIQNLKQTKLTEQASLQQFGVTDLMEADFTNVVNPIMETCTKDSITAGKSWIFNHAHGPDESRTVARFIMRKTLNVPGVVFTQKLHIIYLINDVLHHCLRKGAQDLKQALEENVVQIFYNTHTSAPDMSDSLVKVLKIWKSQNYFSDKILEQIEGIITGNTEALSDVESVNTAPTQTAPPSFPPSAHDQARDIPQPTPADTPLIMPTPWQQHQQQAPPHWRPDQDGAPPSSSRWGQSSSIPWEHQQSQQPIPLFPTSHPEQPPPPPPPPSSHHDQPHPHGEYDNIRGDYYNDNMGGANDRHDAPPRGMPGDNQMFESFDYNHQSRSVLNPTPQEPPPHPSGSREVFDYHHGQPPSGLAPPWRGLPSAPHIPNAPHQMPPLLPPPDMAPWRGPPPPNFPLPPTDLPPPIPYYDLPAGIMVALVPLHEHDYRSLEPRGITLPPPQPPTERLLKAVEEFYISDGEEDKEEVEDGKENEGDGDKTDKENKIKRNEEGWEAGALLNFFEAKRRAKESLMNRYRPRRQLPPRRQRSPTHQRPSRRSYSRSRSRSRSRTRSRSSSRGRSHSKSRSRSRSRGRRRSSRSPTRSSSRSRSRSRSKSSSRSRSPRYRHSSPFTPTVPSSKSYSRDPKPDAGTGDHFNPPWQPEASGNTSISEGNVGHQMMRRMGWEGAGLGSLEQGIQEPIKGGDVRDKVDKYKGVGMDMNDPFEMFRKNRSYTFTRKHSPGR